MTQQKSALEHIGVARRSGRYPWGSGKNPQRNKSLRSHVKELRNTGMKEKDIAAGLEMSIKQMRAMMSIEFAEERKDNIHAAKTFKEKGYSNTAISQRMGVSEGTVRGWLNDEKQERALITENTANMLREQLKDKPFLDVGKGVEHHVGVSRTKLDTAIAQLELEGYHTVSVQTPQMGTNKKTTVLVLTHESNKYVDIVKNHMGDIRTVTDWSEDGGRSFFGLVPVKSINSDRIKVRFAEDGGADMDGVLQLRKGVKDLDLGQNRYSQVRVAVDDEYYMKGMAIYSDKMPPGVDVIYNSNKSKVGANKHDAFKKIEDDPDHPFKSVVRQKFYVDEDGTTKVSALNIMGSKEGAGEEGSWDTWSKTLSSQFLSKQDPRLTKQQLDLTFDIQKAKYDEIMSLTNPAVKQRLLDSFSDDCDSHAVHLKAASMPGQSSKVLIPVPSLKDNEAYTTQYVNGTKLALVRHPHGGTFEIPVVTVNNKNKEGRSVLEQAIDAIGIHPKTAGILSGADFDGDSVIAIPMTKKLKVSDPIMGLKDFDTRAAYKGTPGVDHPLLTKGNKQTEMGKISNLITDMTIKGASTSEITRAVKHSMVVIDAEKHGLDYKQSYKDHGIADLKRRYQGGATKGASTLISRSKSQERVPARRAATNKDLAEDPTLSKGKLARRGEYSIDSATGKKVFVTRSDNEYVDKKGKTKTRTVKSKKMYEEDDAFALSSGTEIERVYAEYANSMKALGDRARKVSANIQPTRQNPSAKKTYANEVASLTSKLNTALYNSPLERQAQLFANSIIKRKKDQNPGLKGDELKKKKAQVLDEARRRVGAKKQPVEITAMEWEAIQMGAVSWNRLQSIMANTSEDSLKELSMPRTKKKLPPSMESRAKVMFARGYDSAEIAEHLGVSKSLLTGLAREN